MATMDAVHGAASRAPQALQRLRRLKMGGDAKVALYENDEGEMVALYEGSFLDNLATLLEHKFPLIPLARAGLWFSGSDVRGCMEERDEEQNGTIHIRKHWFGPPVKVMHGMVHEVWININTIMALSDLVSGERSAVKAE